MDAAQLENAILNLAINSRDAMPNGGTLTVSCFCGRLPAGLDATRDAEEIDYVLVSVTDTGEGIAEDLRSQVFDPFFTTKDIGEGSGLGLSMVQGLVAQSGGHVRIDTKVGSGTTVTLFFPRCEDEAEVTDAGATRGAIEGDGELILVLEDDPAVRSLSLRTLQRLGYRTLDASTARQALSIIRERDDIDLLFSDVVLPGGMSGVDLLGVLRQETPGLPVLFTSGFSTNQDTVMAELGVDVLAKPFNKATLSSALTHTLARQRPSSTAMHSPNVHAATGSSRAIRLLSTGPPPAPPSMAKLTRGDASTRLVESNGGALVARIPRGSPSPE